MSDRAQKHRLVSATPTVLLIETCEADARQFEKRLQQIALHWRVISVKDGAIGIQRMVSDGFPNLLVTCLETPRYGAVDIAEWLQSMNAEQPVPILIHDEPPPDEVRRRLNKLGVTDFLDKRRPAKEAQSLLMQMLERVERRLTLPSLVGD